MSVIASASPMLAVCSSDRESQLVHLIGQRTVALVVHVDPDDGGFRNGQREEAVCPSDTRGAPGDHGVRDRPVGAEGHAEIPRRHPELSFRPFVHLPAVLSSSAHPAVVVGSLRQEELSGLGIEADHEVLACYSLDDGICEALGGQFGESALLVGIGVIFSDRGIDAASVGEGREVR